MLKENFISGDTREFMEKNFDVIAVNIRGDLELKWIDGATYTEQELTEHLKTIATPTIVFLDLDGKKVLQLNGYRDSRSFRYALEYVQSKHYRNQPFAEYLTEQIKPVVYTFRPHSQIAIATYFKGFDKPLAIVFEDRYCAECDRFHDKTLNHPNVLAAMEVFLFVRLDAESDQPLIDVEGQVTTPAQWVKDLGLTYRPAVVLFNQGREMFRADGQLYHHHLTEALRYVGKGYLQYDTLDEFKNVYREELLKEGRDINFAE
jgi:thioredoxin-related protein